MSDKPPVATIGAPSPESPPSSGTQTLAKAIVSVVVLLIYGYAHYLAIKAGGTELGIIIGADGNMAAAVVFYWMGSSAGSDRKTTLLQQNRPPT